MIKLPALLDRTAAVALAIYLLAAIGAMLLVGQTFAADRTIRRTDRNRCARYSGTLVRGANRASQNAAAPSAKPRLRTTE